MNLQLEISPRSSSHNKTHITIKLRCSLCTNDNYTFGGTYFIFYASQFYYSWEEKLYIYGCTCFIHKLKGLERTKKPMWNSHRWLITLHERHMKISVNKSYFHGNFTSHKYWNENCHHRGSISRGSTTGVLFTIVAQVGKTFSNLIV